MATSYYDELREQLVEMRKTMTVKEIADTLGWSEKKVSRMLSKMGLTKPSVRNDVKDEDLLADLDKGLNLRQIAERHACSVEMVRSRLAKHGRRLSPSEGMRRKFAPTYEARWELIQIDLDMGYSMTYVRDKYHIRMENLKKLMREHGYLE